jgi:peptide/nickel transport system ATP-binding protein
VTEPLLKVDGLRKLFPIGRGLFRKPTEFVHAVDGIDFEIGKGESLGLVGESGCGKSTTGRMLTRLMDATSGHILLRANGSLVDVARISREGMKEFRRRVQMIFQDPYESMNPRRTIYDTVAEPLTVQRIGSVKEREEKVAALLTVVGLTPPETFMFRYPHELSGGQRQRIAIARALVIDPDFVVADEPTSMLDVSIRISIMDLMLKLGSEFDVSYLYITHDLAVARYMCDRIAVMYLGKIVELADREALYRAPMHPYTVALMSAVPVPDTRRRQERERILLSGDVPSPISPPPACRFHTRCWKAQEICRTQEPPLVELLPRHQVACHFPENYPDEAARASGAGGALR